MIKNRIAKNLKKLEPWAKRAQIEAYRIYDRDIPEYPYILDVYKDHALVYDKSDSVVDSDPKKANHFNEFIQATRELLNPGEGKLVIKKRDRQSGLQQYEKLDSKDQRFVVQESHAKFWVNLEDYLDTGLFLDHRPMRQRIYKDLKNAATPQKFLNLFCYTGSVSIFAGLAGAETTSVDMSNTYIQWAQDNFRLNDLTIKDHLFVQENALEFLKNAVSFARTREDLKYDMIFLDPPTFSNSKRMEDSFEVERDQSFLVNSCMTILKSNGVLFFSNNKRKFKLEESLTNKYHVKDITEWSIPQDFHDKKIHVCFEIRHKK